VNWSQKQRLEVRERQRSERYDELRVWSKVALLLRINELYRIHSATAETTKIDMISMILEAELPMK